jgi:hypothetical protein
MYRIVSKFVPRLLTEDQRDSRVVICQKLLDHAIEDENFLKRIITGDETWVYGYNVETKMQLMLTGFLTSRMLCIINFYVRAKK